MAGSNFKLFDENKKNMQTDTEYNSDVQRLQGVQTGVASSKLNNKFSYQVSLVAYAITQMMNANGFNAYDSDAVTTFVNNLSQSVLQKVVDKASTSTLPSDLTKWTSPAVVSAIITKFTGATYNNPYVGIDNGGFGSQTVYNSGHGGSEDAVPVYNSSEDVFEYKTVEEMQKWLKFDKLEDTMYPVGSIVQSTDPDFPKKMKGTWLPCDGSVIDKTKYPELYNSSEFSDLYPVALKIDNTISGVKKRQCIYINGYLYAYSFSYTQGSSGNSATVTLNIIKINTVADTPTSENISIEFTNVPINYASSTREACVSYANGYYIVSFSVGSQFFFCYSKSPDSGFVKTSFTTLNNYMYSNEHIPPYFVYGNGRYFILTSFISFSSSQRETIMEIDSLDATVCNQISDEDLDYYLADVYKSSEDGKYYVLMTGGTSSEYFNLYLYDFTNATSSGGITKNSARNNRTYKYNESTNQHLVKNGNLLFYSPGLIVNSSYYSQLISTYQYVDYYNMGNVKQVYFFVGSSNNFMLVSFNKKVYSVFCYGETLTLNRVNNNIFESNFMTISGIISSQASSSLFSPRDPIEESNVLLGFDSNYIYAICFNKKAIPLMDNSFIKASLD